MIFLSDGLPNQPAPQKHAEEEAIAAAEEIADAGGDIQAFALGRGPEQEGNGLVFYAKMAEITGGTLTRLPTPGDVVAHLPQILSLLADMGERIAQWDARDLDQPLERTLQVQD